MTLTTKFGLAHAAYRDFRPSYPATLYQRLLARLDRSVRALDLGAGTGLVTGALLERFDEVVAVEPDVAMAAVLQETHPRARLEVCTAEAAELAPASIDLITCANAFYWMDGPRVAARAVQWLRPGGLLAAWRYPFPRPPSELLPIFARELQTRWAPHRDPRLDLHDYTRASLAATPGFVAVTKELVPHPIELDAARLVGFVASTSFGSAYLRTLTTEHAQAYLEGLERAIVEAVGSVPVTVDFELELVVAERSRELA